MQNSQLIQQMYDSLGQGHGHEEGVAHVEIHGHEVLGLHLVPGLEISAEERDNALHVEIRVEAGAVIAQPVKICFGLIPETGQQRIISHTHIGENAKIGVVASCTFPFAQKILHSMDAEIHLDKGAEYAYIERHVHGPQGGVTIVPRTQIFLGERARFRTDFELLKGRVGEIDMTYEAECEAHSVLEMSARISGRGSDKITINEKAHLKGEDAVGVLTTNIAVRQQSSAVIGNTLIASAPGTRGHVDCKEIIQDEATAQAVPVIDVRHAKAHVTHEAAIGSVDSKQLETLMARGLNEDQATDLIIEGLLSPQY